MPTNYPEVITGEVQYYFLTQTLLWYMYVKVVVNLTLTPIINKRYMHCGSIFCHNY